MSIRDQVFLFTSNVSSIIGRAHLDLVGLISPATVTVAPHGCDTKGGTYAAMYGTDGTALSFDLTADCPHSVSLEDFQAARFIKLLGTVDDGVEIRPVFRDLM